MVNYLHSENDALASKDLASIYDTKTLNKVMAVGPKNAQTVLSELLSTRTRVVVPAEDARVSDALLNVLQCLEIMDMPVTTVPDYLHALKKMAAPASAQVHAKPESSGAAKPTAAPA